MSDKKKKAAVKRRVNRSVEQELKRIVAHGKKYRKKRKGNYPCGENHVQARFTSDQVRAVRQAHKLGLVSIRSLAELYEVTPGTICHIIKRRTYKEVDD